MDRSLISADEIHHLLSYTAAVLDHQAQANEYQSTQSKAITSLQSFFSFVSGECFASSFTTLLLYNYHAKHLTLAQRLGVRGLAISIAVFEVNKVNAFLLA